MTSEKEVPIIQVVTYFHPHYFEMQQSSGTSWEHQKTYNGPQGNQRRKQYGDSWKTASNTRRYHRNATSSWNRKSMNQDQGSNEAVRPCIHTPLGWMDVCAWYHLTKFLSQSYYMYSSHVSTTRHF